MPLRNLTPAVLPCPTAFLTTRPLPLEPLCQSWSQTEAAEPQDTPALAGFPHASSKKDAGSVSTWLVLITMFFSLCGWVGAAQKQLINSYLGEEKTNNRKVLKKVSQVIYCYTILTKAHWETKSANQTNWI